MISVFKKDLLSLLRRGFIIGLSTWFNLILGEKNVRHNRFHSILLS